MASIDFEHIDKIYPGGTQAIFDYNLAVGDGELVAFVGPSGCGKSTLLRLLAGLETASHGTLRIGGQSVNALPPQQRNVAMVFQDYALYPHMTVRRNLEFPLQMRDLPSTEIERQVSWAAELLSLSALLDRLPKQLSGGQRQRVAMGRALVRQPSVFLMDEPLSNLDARLRVQIRAEIGELLERTGITTIYVTHDQAEAMTLGDRVAVMDGGRLQQVAPPRTLYERPANVFVAGFIGNPPMNLFPVRLTPTANGGLNLDLGAQRLPLTLASSVAEHWRAWQEMPLTAGIRPEHLHLAAVEADGLSAKVADAEYLGHETLLHLQIDGMAAPAPVLVARLPGIRPFEKNQLLRLTLEITQLHLFGPDGLTLVNGAADLNAVP
ncbi:MAG: ABC transporter ATP-binding protein [Candidatus Competibacteraceae bacterium]|nr:ABC transporter ATP-binding protein [Candidatus Competibacteraceae bacterium]